jgi:ribonuclease HI
MVPVPIMATRMQKLDMLSSTAPVRPVRPVRPKAWISGRLEEKGPTGVRHEQTSNRAELRAVVGALAFREWAGVRDGSVSSLQQIQAMWSRASQNTFRTWLTRNWLTARGTPVANRDFWEALLERLRDLHHFYTDVLFWQIPRSWNTEADLLAKNASEGADVSEYSPVSGFLC